MKKLLCTLLSLLLCVAMCSCSLITFGGDTQEAEQSTEPTDTSTPEPEEEYPSIVGRLDSARAERDAALDNIPDADFDGLMFLLVCGDTYAAFGEIDTEHSLPREKYERLQLINDRLNTDVVLVEASYDEIESGLNSNSDADMIFAHMLELEVFRVGPLAQAGLLGNIETLPFLDLTRPYYDQEYCREMTTPAGLYSVYGDACLDMNKISAVYYNTRLASDIGIEPLENAVREGAWTVDKLTECVRIAESTSDVGSYVGAVIPETDDFLRRMYIASGMKSTASDGVELTLLDNRTQGDAITQKLRSLLPLCSRDMNDESPAEMMFADGGALFYISNLSGALDFYNMSDAWGVLPMPTADGGTDYRSAMHLYTQVVCYPALGVKSTETYQMIETLFASSYRILDAAMRDDFLHRYARSEDNLDMLTIIADGVRFDLLDAYADAFPKYRLATRLAFEYSSLDDVLYSVRFDADRAAAEAELAKLKKQ